MSNLFDKTADALSKSLDMRLQRHNITSANIANAETPGYVAKKLDFENELARALELEGLPRMDQTHPNHMPIAQGRVGRVSPDIYENPEIDLNNDKNTVNLEKEMATLTENSIVYKAAIELMKKKMAALRYAASDGGR